MNAQDAQACIIPAPIIRTHTQKLTVARTALGQPIAGERWHALVVIYSRRNMMPAACSWFSHN